MLKNDPSKSYTLKQVAAKLPTHEVSARATRVADSKERLLYGGVDYVELAVDTETGRVHIEKVFGAHDCGRPINPTGVISQITAASSKAFLRLVRATHHGSQRGPHAQREP